MRRFLVILNLLVLSACATNQANKVRQSELDMSGGSYETKTWKDTLEFKRTSWFLGANLGYDVLIAKLDKNSPFAFWLGNNQEQYATNCRELYIALIYTNSMSMLYTFETPAAIRTQITQLGFEEVSISHFHANIRAHQIFGQWHLRNHKAAGFCYKKMSSRPQEIPLTLPGFETQNLLHK